jgi:membrane-associated phospholipid phosphatase
MKSSIKIGDSKKNYMKFTLWTVYTLFMVLVGISRLYTATHFPHQALLGLVAGSVTLICKTFVQFCNAER